MKNIRKVIDILKETKLNSNRFSYKKKTLILIDIKQLSPF